MLRIRIFSDHAARPQYTAAVFANMADDDFAETIYNTIRFNNKSMRNTAADFTGIAVHEMGHIISANVSVYSVDVPFMKKKKGQIKPRRALILGKS